MRSHNHPSWIVGRQFQEAVVINPAPYRCTLPKQLLNIYEKFYNNCIISKSAGLSRGFVVKLMLYSGMAFSRKINYAQ
jgi:hypothetical protein